MLLHPKHMLFSLLRRNYGHIQMLFWNYLTLKDWSTNHGIT